MPNRLLLTEMLRKSRPANQYLSCHLQTPFRSISSWLCLTLGSRPFPPQHNGPRFLSLESTRPPLPASCLLPSDEKHHTHLPQRRAHIPQPARAGLDHVSDWNRSTSATRLVHVERSKFESQVSGDDTILRRGRELPEGPLGNANFHFDVLR